MAIKEHCSRSTMGRIWNKVKNGATNAGRWLWGKVIKPTGKFLATKGLKIGKFVTDVGQYLPGMIGTISGIANKGFNAAQAAVDALPGGKIHDALTQGLSQAGGMKDRVIDGAEKAAGVAQAIAGITDALMNTSKDIAGTVRQVI